LPESSILRPTFVHSFPPDSSLIHLLSARKKGIGMMYFNKKANIYPEIRAVIQMNKK